MVLDHNLVAAEEAVPIDLVVMVRRILLAVVDILVAVEEAVPIDLVVAVRRILPAVVDILLLAVRHTLAEVVDILAENGLLVVDSLLACIDQAGDHNLAGESLIICQYDEHNHQRREAHGLEVDHFVAQDNRRRTCFLVEVRTQRW